MGFSAEIKQEVLVKSARHCCVCHNFKGLNIEVHHIQPKAQGGEDTFENAIALCFDCHADAGHYFAGHPKGLKLSRGELIKHKEEWFSLVKSNNIKPPSHSFVEIVTNNQDFNGVFQPVFVQEKIQYTDRNALKELYQLLGKDPMEHVNNWKEQFKDSLEAPLLKKITTYDEYIDYLNDLEKRSSYRDDVENGCQPILHRIGAFNNYKIINKSNCLVKLKLFNHGPEVLEDFKIYLSIENVVSSDSVNKRTSVFNTNEYYYNIIFNEKNSGEFIPDRNILVQNDSIPIDPICFRPIHSAKEVIINWELFARNFQEKGTVKLSVEAQFEEMESVIYVENKNSERTVMKIIPKIEIE
jgi:hypothetical protein